MGSDVPRLSKAGVIGSVLGHIMVERITSPQTPEPPPRTPEGSPR